jgi:serine/threonine-protein kinase
VSVPGGNEDDLERTRAAGAPVSPPLPRIPGVKLQYEIARGGMGVVYRGRQDFIDREVAVKLLSAQLTDRAFVARFRREAKILAGIDHPNIVGCHFAGETEDGQSFLVMEFVPGQSLKAHLTANGPLPAPTALRAILALVQALGHANGLGIIHRDVKPENILLAEVKGTAADVGFPFVPKLVDLGLARANEGTGSFGLTSPGSVMGTPATMSPEQFDEPEAVDFRTDIYGLGCVLYEMLVGRPAFQAKKLTDLFAQKRQPVAPDACEANPEVPAAAGALAQWMLATDRAARPGSYDELAARITALLDDPAVAAAGDLAATRVGRRPEALRAAAAPPSRSRRLAFAGALVFMGAIAVFLFSTRNDGEPSTAGPAPGTAPSNPPANPPATGGAAAAGAKPMATNVRVDGPTTAALAEGIELSARADAPPGAALQYAWTLPTQLAKSNGPIDASTLRLELVDGVPGLEVPIQVVVRAGDGPEVAVEHRVRVADAPPAQPLLGSKRLGSGWRYDRIDAAWAEVPDAVAGLSCEAKTERRTVTRQLGEDAYWEWSGALESAEAEGTPFAVVAVRFCWADSGLQVECRRQGSEGAAWKVDATAIALGSRGETRRALPTPLLQAYQQPALMSDDPKRDWEPRAWFAVRRLGDELQVRVGIDNRPPEGTIVEETRSEWTTLPAPAGPCRVELVVDKGIGRFFLISK